MNIKKWLRNRRRAADLLQLGRHAEILPPQRWIFIVGCYNSGTTLLHDVLASHPDVASLPREGQYCTDQLLIPSEAGFARAWALQAEQFTLNENSSVPPDPDIILRQWSNLMQPAGKKIYVEKTVPNAGRIRWLNAHFSNAHFVALVRNGYAVAEGIHRKAGLPLDQAAAQWQKSNAIMLADLKQVKNTLLLNYETFTENPETTIQQLFNFAGLDTPLADPGQQSWTVHGVHSTITNMNAHSLDRLSAASILKITANAGDMLKQTGYTAPKI